MADASSAAAPASTTSQKPLSGKVAFVTGGTSGLGLSIARGLREAGCTVAVGSRSAAKVAAAVAELGGEPHAFGIEVDVADAASIAAAFETLRGRYDGNLDILVTAAGIINRAPALEEKLEDFERVIRTNLTGTFLCCQHAGRMMKERGTGGAILCIASLTAHVALADVTAYSVSKAGVAQLVRSLASDLGGKYSIRVNGISPGVFPTDINRASISGTPRGAWMIQQTPLARFGDTPEISGLAVFLCSPAASFITGAVIPCDGGFLARGVGPS